jgi:hypothetical protein
LIKKNEDRLRGGALSRGCRRGPIVGRLARNERREPVGHAV